MATIRDVARESGVSVATVSYVMNKSPQTVRDETRQRVLAAARRLNYQPNAMARGLVRRRMNILGVLFHVSAPTIIIDPYASALLQGILTAAAATGFSIILFPERWRDASHSAAPLRERHTDGILASAPGVDSDMLPSLVAQGLPFVAIAAPSNVPTVIGVDVDNEKGARLATEHLLSLGHRRIAHLTGNPNEASAQARLAGFRATLAQAGVSIPAEYIVPSLYKGRISYDKTLQLLALPEPPTAIFAGNDNLAMEVLEAARDRGVSVPSELSVVGFDDIPAASLVTPPLTTVHQPLARIGETAARLLVARVAGEPVPAATHLLEPELIIRGTTAAAAPPSVP